MNRKSFLIVVAVILIFNSCKKDIPISDFKSDLVLIRKNGYGPFPRSFHYLTFEPIKNDFLGIARDTIIGFPNDWIESNSQFILIDPNQYLYQNYKAGNINQETYQKTKKRYKINTEKRSLSDTPIRCSIHIGIGKKRDGSFEFIVDENRNNDLSDDEIRIPLKDVFAENQNLEKGVLISYDLSTAKGVIKKQTNLVVGTNNGEDDLMYNFADFYETQLEGEKICVSNDFLNVLFDSNTLVSTSNSPEDIFEINEYFKIDDSTYKNLGVDLNTNKLNVQKIPNDSIIYSSQIGYYGIPFSVPLIASDGSASLSDFNGKFVYIDFWGTWCGNCIQEISLLKSIYTELSNDNLEFLSISVDDKPDDLISFINERQMTWPQARVEKTDEIIKDYNIQFYPTSYLVGPNGKIIAKNVRANKLKDTLQYYLKLKR